MFPNLFKKPVIKESDLWRLLDNEKWMDLPVESRGSRLHLLEREKLGLSDSSAVDFEIIKWQAGYDRRDTKFGYPRRNIFALITAKFKNNSSLKTLTFPNPDIEQLENVLGIVQTYFGRLPELIKERPGIVDFLIHQGTSGDSISEEPLTQANIGKNIEDGYNQASNLLNNLKETLPRISEAVSLDGYPVVGPIQFQARTARLEDTEMLIPRKTIPLTQNGLGTAMIVNLEPLLSRKSRIGLAESIPMLSYKE